MKSTIELLGNGCNWNLHRGYARWHGFNHGCGSSHGCESGGGFGDGWGHARGHGDSDGDGIGYGCADNIDTGLTLLVCNDPLWLICAETKTR